MAKNETQSPAGGRVVGLDDDSSPAVQDATGGVTPVAAKVIVAGRNHDSELSGRNIIVTFHEQDGDLGKLPVDVGLNGFAYKIPRGIEVTIPEEVLGVIKDAKQEIFEANGTSVVKRERPRFAYTVHGPAADSALAA